jgi:uncharacterized membrane protein YdjX (TVP38/TMEM64 family)
MPAMRRGAWLKAGLSGAAIVAILLAGREIAGEIPRFAAWVAALGVWGPVAFMAGYAVAAVFLIPGSWLTLAAGALFGVAWGTLYVMVGATAGAALAFLTGRYVARGLVERRLGSDARFAAIDRAIGAQGVRLVLLLRLTPVVPFNLLNYALGLTRVRFTHYLAGSIGMLPAVLLFVYTGRMAGDLAVLAAGAPVTPRGPGYYAVLILGLAATLTVTVVMTRLARRALRQALPES